MGVFEPTGISFTWLLFWSPIKMLPFESTAIPAGMLKPEPSVVVLLLYDGAAAPPPPGLSGVMAVPAA